MARPVFWTREHSDCERIRSAREYINKTSGHVIREATQSANVTLREMMKGSSGVRRSDAAATGAAPEDTDMSTILSAPNSKQRRKRYSVPTEQFAMAFTSEVLHACTPSLPAVLDNGCIESSERSDDGNAAEPLDARPYKRVGQTSEELDRDVDARVGLVDFADYRPVVDRLERATPKKCFVSSATGFSMPPQHRNVSAYFPINSDDVYEACDDDVQIVESKNTQHVLEEGHIERFSNAEPVPPSSLAPMSYTQPKSKFWDSLFAKYLCEENGCDRVFDLSAHDRSYSVRNADGTERRSVRRFTHRRSTKPMESDGSVPLEERTERLEFRVASQPADDDVVISSLPPSPANVSDDDDDEDTATIGGADDDVVSSCLFRESVEALHHKSACRMRGSLRTLVHLVDERIVSAALDLADKCVSSNAMSRVVRIMREKHELSETCELSQMSCAVCSANTRLCALVVLCVYIYFRTNVIE